MTTGYYAPKEFQVGRVISRTFGIVWRNILTLELVNLVWGVGLFVVILASVIAAGAGSVGAAAPSGSAMISVGFTTFIAVFVYILTFMGSVFAIGLADARGEKLGFGPAMGASVRHILPLVGLGLLQTLVYLLLTITIIGPMILNLFWAVTAQVVVNEKVGVLGAFGRSAKLTENHRGAIFGTHLLLGLIGGALYMVFIMIAFVGVGLTGRGLDPSATTNLSPTFLVVSMMAGLIQFALWPLWVAFNLAGGVAIYTELRIIKDPSTDVAATFS